MKTSKKIFLSFFALMLIILIALPIYIKKSISDAVIQKEEYNQEEISLPPFNHLIINNNTCTEIGEADENTISYSFPKDSLIDVIEYQLSGDTLILPSQETRKKQRVKINCGKLKSITYQVSLSINKSQDTLTICSKAGQAIIRGDSFKQLNIEGQGGKVRTTKSLYIDELNVHLNNTKLDFYNVQINKLNATMKNKARLSIKKANSISISKDETCQFKESA